ncbi:peptidase S9, prolyl oligopeptidase [Betaproteobacteria bacterium GR16-43]|nr:peptidase S9, prolyl oligopeptidase [Betaproteobacteria bacterium GR16-43]
MIRRLCLAAALAFVANAQAQEDLLKPNANLIAEGLPPIPMETMKQVAPYNDFKLSRLYSWHPIRREVLVGQRLQNTIQVQRVSEPGAPLEPLTDFRDGVPNASYQPTTGEYFLFPRAEGGNETFRIYRFDVATKTATPFTPESERASNPVWSPNGDRIAYTTQPVDRNNPDKKVWVKLHIVNPLKPETDKVFATLDGGGWGSFTFSQDGRRLAFLNYKSINESDLWVMDIATGRKRQITRAAKGEQVSWNKPRFSKDGKGLYATTDRDSEFQRLVYLPLNGGEEQVLSAQHKFDVDDFEVSFDANRIAFITNERGSHVLRFIDLATRKELPRPPLFDGVIGGLEWRPKSDEVGFSITSARSAGDVFSYDLKANKLVRWTNGNNPAVNTSAFVEPRLIKWKSFDGLEISGFHYQPSAKFTGKRPVIINVHGGPESQSRAGFIGSNNYLVNELGVAVIFPNVRGSAGFGKTFLKLDNGKKRVDSVKDLGALIDWIKEQPDLDADRVQVRGGSYGGYVTLAAAYLLNDRIAGSISVVGISNFVTFLERTESYRRDLRRAEYGDERDPEMRTFLESISPLNHTAEMKKPMFVVQGFNDPRVPYTEAEQIKSALAKAGTPVWFLMARDEGHGFAKKDNTDFLLAATVEFTKATLLK